MRTLRGNSVRGAGPAYPARHQRTRRGTKGRCFLPRPAGPQSRDVLRWVRKPDLDSCSPPLECFVRGTARTIDWSWDGIEIQTPIFAHPGEVIRSSPVEARPPTVQPAVPVVDTKTSLWSLTNRTHLDTEAGSGLGAPADVPHGHGPSGAVGDSKPNSSGEDGQCSSSCTCPCSQ